eukprot:Amastigsp_a3327_38.p3 type:complete len:159 gc:universal Amastigsp_a3327_38:17-493(+)
MALCILPDCSRASAISSERIRLCCVSLRLVVSRCGARGPSAPSQWVSSVPTDSSNRRRGDHAIQGHVRCGHRYGVHNLGRKRNADFCRRRKPSCSVQVRELAKEPVVEPRPMPTATAAGIECDSGNKHEIDRRCSNRIGRGLHDSVRWHRRKACEHLR